MSAISQSPTGGRERLNSEDHFEQPDHHQYRSNDDSENQGPDAALPVLIAWPE
jgi:hypothetical protein